MIEVNPPAVQVSVIVPAFNAERTLVFALDSVLQQAIPGMEIIVVDDASTDGTRACFDAWLREHPEAGRVLTLSRNSGPAAARNHGVAEARGEWLAFLDSDDSWLPWRLTTQLTLTARFPDVDLWCGGRMGMDGALPAPPRLNEIEPHPIILDDFLTNNPVGTTTVLLRHEAFKRVGGFDEQFRGPEDYDLWMRVAAVGKLARIDCPLCRYRLTIGSLCMDERKFLPQVLRVLDKAFGPGGVLADRPELRRVAEENQYWNASWMAFHRGDRWTAIRYWGKAYGRYWMSGRGTPRAWWRLLIRYGVGRRKEGEVA